jgi:hypothetical protein
VLGSRRNGGNDGEDDKGCKLGDDTSQVPTESIARLIPRLARLRTSWARPRWM